MKLTIAVLKPRNPLVGPARIRRAGAHRLSTTSRRQDQARALRRTIAQMKEEGP